MTTAELYLKIPNNFFKLKVSHVERYILALMSSYGGETYASNQKLADSFGVSKQAIINAVNKLESRGYIIRTRGKNGKTITLTSKETLLLGEVATSQETLPQPVKKLYKSSKETLPNSKYIEKIKEKDARNNKPKLEKFNTFWTAYPKKVSKQSAQKAFAKINPDDDLMETILSAVASQSQSEQWTKDDGKFIPYPATWLNGRRWEDETQTTGGYVPRYPTENEADELFRKIAQ